MKILVVEDNERVARFVTRGLREAGHTVEHADNGRDGLFSAASEAYDVIVMDRMLPGNIDGLTIIETLRQAGNRTPITAATACSAPRASPTTSSSWTACSPATSTDSRSSRRCASPATAPRS